MTLQKTRYKQTVATYDIVIYYEYAYLVCVIFMLQCRVADFWRGR